jgi:hypothetical protein
MEPDQRLLHDALTARDRLTALQEEAERGRLAYYQAVRRLHSSGVSMRDIAEALSLSHQRVHQIVNGGEQMARATPARTLLHRLVHRSPQECGPGPKPRDPAGHLLDRFYVDARTALERAQDEARAFGHPYIGTEHLLLGLLRTEHGVAAHLLAVLGVEAAPTRGAVETRVGRGAATADTAATPPGHLPLTLRLKKVLELARQEARRLHSTHVRSEHLLLGLAREGGGVAAHILAERHGGYDQLRGRVDRAALACAFCGRSGLDVARLIAGPGVYICEHCTQDACRLADQRAGGTPPGALRVVADEPAATCSFCGTGRSRGDRLIAGPDVLICTACLDICREILVDEACGAPERG